MVSCTQGSVLVEYAIVLSFLSIAVLPAVMRYNTAVQNVASKQMTGYTDLVANPSWQGTVQAGQGGQYCNAALVVACP